MATRKQAKAVEAPDGFGDRGRAFWEYAAAAFDLDQHEAELVTQVCRLLDRADALRAEVVEHGVVLVSARGDRRPNPAVAEERQVSLALGRLLGQLEIPYEDDEESTLATPTQARARRAAQSRWSRRRPGRGA